MRHYLVFQRGAQDRKVLADSGYPCAALMAVVTNGIVVGAAILLWLGVFTAHNATDWLTSSYEERGYRMSGGIEADSAEEALHAYRDPKRPTALPENASSVQLGDTLTVTPAETIA